jgi:hypothetical protein
MTSSTPTTVEPAPAAPGAHAARPAAPPAATPARRPPRPSLRGFAWRQLTRALGPGRFEELHALWWLARRSEWKAPLPLGFKLKVWRRGFYARHAAIYDPAGLARGEYVSDYARDYRCAKINPVPPLFNHKLILRRILADRGFAQPETVAMVAKGEIVADPLGAGRRVSAAELEARMIADGGRYICKPQVGAFGSGVVLLEVRDGALVTRRGRTVRPFSLARDARPVSLIERAIEQHPFWQALSPYSVNTLRMLTLWTPGDAEPFIGRVLQRVGTEATLPTDNWSGGGVCVPVDLETGRLGAGRVYRFESDREDRPYPRHPDTDAPIEGLVLPGWSRIKDVVLAAARSLPYANYIGWDVAVAPDGTPVFIEGNHNTGVKMMQAHGGLLVDPAIRRFYEVCGVV